MSKELNLRNTNTHTTWTVSKPLSPAELDAAQESNTNSSASLNALPTPFARFHIFKEAFRRVKAEGDKSGKAYTRLVSHCLDLLELLFHSKYHKEIGEVIEVLEWNKTDELNAMKRVSPVLASSLERYLADPDFIGINTFYFIVLDKGGNKTLLGCSSPYSLLATKPDLDLGQTLDIKKMNGRKCYFKEIVLFEDRDKEFQQYLFNLVNGQNNSKLSSFQDYIVACTKGFSVQPIASKEILSMNNSPLSVEGISLQESLSAIQPFVEHLFRVPFKVRSTFHKVQFDGREPEYDYLLPLSDAALNRFRVDNNMKIHFKESNTGDVEVELFVSNVSIHKKKYESKDIISIDKYNLYLAILPLHREANFNRYFSLYAAVQQNETKYPIDNPIQIELFDYANGSYQLVQEGDNGVMGVRRSVRTKPTMENNNLFSVVHEAFGTSIELIRINLKHEGNTYQGVIAPKFDTIQFSNVERIYAIDLGTTNTFVCCSNANDTNIMSPLSTGMLSIPLFESKNDRNMVEVQQIEGEVTATLSLFHSEFMPVKIDNDVYKFPIRTALNSSMQSTSLEKLFGDGNIAFNFEKNLLFGDNKAITNIKWEQNTDSVRLYIRQLLYLIRMDMIANRINPAMTTLVWFKPLSFSSAQEQRFNKIWNSEAMEILSIQAERIEKFSESETPYYYYKEKGNIGVAGTSVVLDIGGGTTDIVVYNDTKPALATSLKFGCNLLWNKESNNERNNRENGIFNKLKQNVRLRDGSAVKQLFDQFVSAENITTADIVNLLIAHNSETKAVDYLERDFKEIYLFHYVSLLYHTAQITKTNKLNPPRTIVFSGNGSRYLDYLTHKIDLLERIANFVFGKIYESEVSTIKIVLPKTERKEATCYGGIRKAQENNPNETVEHRFYLGLSHKDKHVEYENFSEIKKNKATLLPQIADNIVQLLACYAELFSKLSLVKEFGIEGHSKRISDIERHLKVETANAVKDVFVGLPLADEDSLNESLFFPPVALLLSELTDLLTKD